MATMFLQSPVGILEIEIGEKSVQKLKVSNKKSIHEADRSKHEATKQLQEFFAGKRSSFDLPVDAEGTAFQKAVWSATASIPFGETRTYGDIAKMIGKPKAARAVGQALNKNPVCIVVPCHRVVGSNNRWGYAYGEKMKKWLLEHEEKYRV